MQLRAPIRRYSHQAGSGTFNLRLLYDVMQGTDAKINEDAVLH